MIFSKEKFGFAFFVASLISTIFFNKYFYIEGEVFSYSNLFFTSVFFLILFYLFGSCLAYWNISKGSLFASFVFKFFICPALILYFLCLNSLGTILYKEVFFNFLGFFVFLSVGLSLFFLEKWFFDHSIKNEQNINSFFGGKVPSSFLDLIYLYFSVFCFYMVLIAQSFYFN